MLETLRDPMMQRLFLTALLAGLSVVVMSAVLSVLVVVKRLGFVGQGVSHSAFGGIGVAALVASLGLAGDPASTLGALVQLAIVVVFCVATAIGMAAVSNEREVPADTAIGMFLVASMALGAILLQVARQIAQRAGRPMSVQSWESILFGSIFTASERDALVGWLVALGVVASLWLVRRPLLFWAFDETAARAFGVLTKVMRTLLMVLLALAVVVAMKLAGVVLATALLVLPGAAALRMSRRLWPVVLLSIGLGALGLVSGLAISISLDWQPGPCVVSAMLVEFVLASAVGTFTRRSDQPAHPSA